MCSLVIARLVECLCLHVTEQEVMSATSGAKVCPTAVHCHVPFVIKWHLHKLLIWHVLQFTAASLQGYIPSLVYSSVSKWIYVYNFDSYPELMVVWEREQWCTQASRKGTKLHVAMLTMAWRQQVGVAAWLFGSKRALWLHYICIFCVGRSLSANVKKDSHKAHFEEHRMVQACGKVCSVRTRFSRRWHIYITLLPQILSSVLRL